MRLEIAALAPPHHAETKPISASFDRLRPSVSDTHVSEHGCDTSR